MCFKPLQNTSVCTNKYVIICRILYFEKFNVKSINTYIEKGELQ